MMSSLASEVKQQGVLEAARDPDVKISADAAETAVVKEAQKAGGAAFKFDPDASADDKAAQAHAAIPDGLQHIRKPKASALVSDKDDIGKANYDLPQASQAVPASPNDSLSKTNGNVGTDEKARWERVGWAPRFGSGETEEEEATLADHQTWLEGKLDDKFYGDWYHNAGIIVFACLTSWVVAVLGGGLGWIFIVMAFCGTYYRTSIRRVRRNFRDDVNRQMAKARLETDTESLEWINSFLVKFWPIYAPVLCETIVKSVDQVLSTSTPAFLDSLRMKLFVLGTKPPRLEHVKTYPKADDDIVLMDWKFSFTPNDVSDLTARQIKNKQNPKVVLEIRLGKGVVSKGLDVIVEDMAFVGLMRVKVKLQIPFPHVEKIEVCFLERPMIDYVCKPLGGDAFGFDINVIPGLESFIQEQIHANLAPMMYAPNVFPVEVAKILAGNPVDEAVGVLQVTFHGAKGLKNPDKFSGTPDPYAIVSINNRVELGRTKTISENANPRWNETVNIIITSLSDSLTLQVFDFNDFRKDKELGTATFALEQLERENVWENQRLEVMSNGRNRGLLEADVRFFPVLSGAKMEDGTEAPPPESLTGIAKLTVEQAKELDGTKSMFGQLNPYAVLLLNGKEVHTSKVLKRTNNPVWPDASKEILITDRRRAKLGLAIKDDRDLASDPRLGVAQLKLDDMLENMANEKVWYNLSGAQSGRVKMTLQWKPVSLTGAAGSGGYVTPIGVMRFHIQNARSLPNVETLGKSDPYARILLSGIEKVRTVTFKNNLDPDFDEVLYIPVHSTREKILLEVMDHESMGKDRPLGHTEVAVMEYAQQNDDGEYLVSDTREVIPAPLRSGKGSTKGTLNYTCSFFPTLNVVDPDDEEDEATDTKADADGDAKSHKSSSSSSSSSSDEEKQPDKLTNGMISPLKVGERESMDRKASLVTSPTSAASSRGVAAAGKERPKIKIGVDDLSKYPCGLVVFKIIEGQFNHTNCHLEVVMDDMLYPSYKSPKIKSHHSTFNDVGDAMVRELDFSRMTLRIVEEGDSKGSGKDEHMIAKLSGNTIDTLKRCLYEPMPLVLKDNDGREEKVTVSLRYIPVQMQLNPSESINNQGNLRVEVLDATDLPAADRNGYSDPYCKFFLNDKEVYKTEKQKKTLHPAWNEFFETSVSSRTAARFEVRVFDWDFGDKADFLGKADINLMIIEPFMQQEVALGLDGKSGTIRLKLLFKPDYVTRARQGSSTFHGTFATPGKIVGAPVKGVGKGAVFVGGSMAKGASFLGRGFRRRKSIVPDEGEGVAAAAAAENGAPPVPAMPEAHMANGDSPSTPHNRTRSFGAQSMASAGNHGASPGNTAETGTATLTIVSASGYPPGTNVRVHVSKVSPGSGGSAVKEIHKTKAVKASSPPSFSSSSSPSPAEASFAGENETAKVHSCTADTQFKLVVKDHSFFGVDDELGEGLFFVDDQGSGGAEKSVRVGEGVVVVKSSFVPAETGSVAAGNSSLLGVGGGSPSGNKLRRSFMGGRWERSMTPTT